MKKIRVSHDAKGVRREWYLDRIELTNMQTKKQYVFIHKNWLSKKENSLSVDIPLFKHGHETIGQTIYRLTVKTSDISGAGTNANVFVVLFGENGDSGELELKKSETNSDKFERNKTDVFTFNGILSLGELTKLRVRHDNSGSLIGNTHWHLEYIKVDDLASGRSYKFECNKWLSESKDDKQIVRDLTLNAKDFDHRNTPRLGDRTSYEVVVHTADERDAGCKQNLELIIVGENNQDVAKLFENTYESKILRRGQADKFVFKSKSIGTIKKLYLRLVERQDEPAISKEDRSWLCDQVVVKDLGTDISYVFRVKDMLLLNEPPKIYRCDAKQESAVVAVRSLKNVTYEVSIVTSSESVASTGAKGYINIFGQNGDSGKRPLKKGFEKGQTDIFKIECVDLGQLKKIHVEHDNSSFNKVKFV